MYVFPLVASVCSLLQNFRVFPEPMYKPSPLAGAGGVPIPVRCPDLTIGSRSGTRSSIHIFGELHGEMGNGGAAGFIVQHRPAFVVCETAIDSRHGRTTGATVTCQEVLSSQFSGQWDPSARWLAQQAVQLRESILGIAVEGSPLRRSSSSSIKTIQEGVGKYWQSLVDTMPGEQLAYLAAFLVDAQLVFGDRPKRETYRRLLHVPSLKDLDAAFGWKSVENYRDLVGDLSEKGVKRGSETEADCDDPGMIVERILMTERNIVLRNTIVEMAKKVENPEEKCVVAVVGKGHVEGLAALPWHEDDLLVVEEDPDDNEGHILRGVVHHEESEEEKGVRRALFDGLIRLTCRPDVLADIDRTLPSTLSSPEAMEAYELSSEVYGSCRMLLACLETPEELAAVCQGWRCDMFALLEPLRALRPVAGGPGFSAKIVEELRCLNYEIQ